MDGVCPLIRRLAMEKHVLVLTTSAFILACGATTASAQQSPGSPMMQQPDHQQSQQRPTDEEGPDQNGTGMAGPGGIMGPGMMRIIFALMDSDGDGTLSLQEFQAAHERIFRAMDANKDGHLTLEEMQAFMHGTRRSVPQQ